MWTQLGGLGSEGEEPRGGATGEEPWGGATERSHGEEPQWGAATQMWGQAEGLEATCRVARVGSNSRNGPWVFTLHPGPTSQCHPRPQKCS